MSSRPGQLLAGTLAFSLIAAVAGLPLPLALAVGALVALGAVTFDAVKEARRD